MLLSGAEDMEPATTAPGARVPPISDTFVRDLWSAN